MKRWLVVVLVIAACASKKQDPVPAWAAGEPTPTAEAEAVPAPVPLPPEPEPPSAPLPPECQRYRTIVAALGSCPELPPAVHDDVMRIYLPLERTWAAASPGDLAALAGTCQQAADTAAQMMSSCPAVAAVPPLPSVASRTGPIERGVPLDQASLGPLPHPFGALEFLRAGSSRDEILAALPNARRDGDSKILVPLGVEELMAQIDIDYTGHLDVVKIAVSPTARDRLVEAWGAPTATGAWFDRTRRWRADLAGGVLMIGPFVPLAELLGGGPDGLAETKAVIGATPAELTERFGARIAERALTDDSGALTGAHGYNLLLPATEVCKYYTNLHLELDGGRVVRATLHQCFDDEAARRAALAAVESKWGRAIAARGSDDRPVFTFNVPRRRVEARLVEPGAGYPAWSFVITAR